MGQAIVPGMAYDGIPHTYSLWRMAPTARRYGTTQNTLKGLIMEYTTGTTVHYHAPWKPLGDDKVYSTLVESDYGVALDETPECNEEGCVLDIIGNWETAESMILENGCKVITLDPANQTRMDTVLAEYKDCWGL